MAETKKHDRLIDEAAYAKLDDAKKQRAVRLNGGYYIIYPLSLAQESFQITQEKKRESEKTQLRNREDANKSLNSENANADFKVKNQQLDKFLVNGSSVLDKDWRLFKKASPEMDWVKKSLNALNSVLAESLDQYFDQNGLFDAKKYQERLDQAYDEFLTAAENYCAVKNPSSRPGIRRKNQVAALLKRVKQMKLESKSLIDAAKEGAIDFEHMTPETKQSLNSHNLVDQLVTSEADLEGFEWQNQGNSTDVYRLKLVGGDGRFYYLKENLPFLNENIEGFLSRRTKQLETSKSNKEFNSGLKPEELKTQAKPVEERLSKISDKDYDNGTKLLKALSDDLKSVSDDKRSEAEARISGYFAHNFDDIFRRLEYNNLLAGLDLNASNKSIDQQINEAREKGDSLLEAALKYAKSISGTEQKAEFKMMTAKEWIQAEMGLDANRDKAFLKALEGLSDKEAETLFRVTMGKEVELFGQMSAQKMQTATDKAAVNNTATSRLAEHMGFDDVITKSRTALVKFTRRDGTTVNQLCTLCEEAPGEEMVDLMKEAESTGKQITLSSEAIRDLMRLHAADTLTLQKDRHGRNLKSTTNKTGQNIIIKSVKAYDNDMSFDAVTLAEAFKNGGPEQQKMLQFLPNMTTKIEKGSALYKMVLGSYFGVDVLTPEKKIVTPEIKLGTVNLKMGSNEMLGYGMHYMWKNSNTANILTDGFGISNHFRASGADIIRKPIENPAAFLESKKAEIAELNIKMVKGDSDYNIKQYAFAKLAQLQQKIKKIWTVENLSDTKVNARDFLKNGLKKELSLAERKELDEAIEELRALNEQFNFSHLKNDVSVPVVDAFIKSTIFLYDVTYGDKIENRIATQNKHPEAIGQLMDKDGNLEIPSMLHFDADAYRQLQKTVNEFNNPNSVIVQKLKEVGLSDEKIQALHTRNVEMLNYIDNVAKPKAMAFYRAAGWDQPGDVRGQFLLEKEDYKKFTKLTDFAVDPGRTYLAIDNENFLAGQKIEMVQNGVKKMVPFTDLMNDVEKQEAKNYNEYIKNDEKRWKYTEQEKGKKVFDKNNTMNGAANAIDGKEYIRCVREDMLYDISHKPIQSKAEFSQKMWNALLVNSLQNQADNYEDPLPMKTAQKLIENTGKAAEEYQNLLNSTVGKIYKAKVDEYINNKFEKNEIKKIDGIAFENMNKEALEFTMNSVFKQLTSQANLDPANVAKYARKTESMAKKFGVELSAEKAFDDFVKKNPNVSPELQQAVKEAGLKPEPKAPKKAVEEKNIEKKNQKGNVNPDGKNLQGEKKPVIGKK